MNSIYISHGDKGGIGKSYIAAGTVDTLLANDSKGIVIIVDGDSGEDGKNNADVGPRFENHPRVFTIIAPLNNPKRGVDAIYKAMDDVMTALEKTETNPDEITMNIVINTPANFSHTFTEDTQTFFKQMAEDIGMGVKIIYSVGETSLSRSSASEFVGNSVFGGENIIMAFPTKSVDEEAWMDDKVTAKIVKNNMGFIVPKMSHELVNIYDGNPGKSLGYFFSTENDFDPATLGFRDKLKNRMISNHVAEISSALNEFVINKEG